ncbi:MAG: ABC transporter ATP-binding protein [Gammaproteobacteria bacterium]|nr:ABC transporter ATP-binding protein [Gammaproteobacteria bacterium]
MHGHGRFILANDALVFDGVDAYYGDSLVLHGVSFRLREGALLGLLGRNGAGKSTCMNVTVGLLAARRGSVKLFSETISGLTPEEICRKGVALVPQTRRIFKNLTVYEHLLVAARRPVGVSHDLWTEETVYEAFPRLAERKKQLAGSLSGGEQQMLAIGRALMSNPRVLLMDEPSEGLAPQIVAEVMATVGRLRGQGLSIVLVEQNAKLVFDIADDIVILNTGRVVVTDSAERLRASSVDLSEHLGVF